MTATKLAQTMIGDTVSLSPQQLLVAGKFMIAGDNFLIVRNEKTGEYECAQYDNNQEKMRLLKDAYFVDMHSRRITRIDSLTYNNALREKKVRRAMDGLYGEKYAYEKCREKRPDRRRVRSHVMKTDRHRVLYNRRFPNHVTVAVVGYTTDF